VDPAGPSWPAVPAGCREVLRHAVFHRACWLARATGTGMALCCGADGLTCGASEVRIVRCAPRLQALEVLRLSLDQIPRVCQDISANNLRCDIVKTGACTSGSRRDLQELEACGLAMKLQTL